MLNFCDFIQVYICTTNHHLKLVNRRSYFVNPKMDLYANMYISQVLKITSDQ